MNLYTSTGRGEEKKGNNNYSPKFVRQLSKPFEYLFNQIFINWVENLIVYSYMPVTRVKIYAI